MEKPLTMRHCEYMQKIVSATNQSDLPAFIMVEVLESVLREIRPAIEMELKRDMATYRAALQSEPEKGDSDGRQNDS